MVPLFERAAAHARRTAVVDADGSYKYKDLLDASARAAGRLLAGRADLDEARVAFLVTPGFSYAATQWGIWRAGGVAVPLAVMYPRPELEYVVNDSQAEILVAHPSLAERLRPVAEQQGRMFLTTDALLAGDDSELPAVAAERRAMMLYTSGTTGKPKGVVTTHANVQAQVTSLIEAWAWEADDHVPLVLPLHHIHGIINVLTCALWAGATCEMPPAFDAEDVWDRLLTRPVTLFMAVPTIYVKLIAAWQAAPPERQRALSEACGKLRLMVSGSAALPVSVLERWREITGHVLLERYGMTEIGMALSNPLDGQRVPGCVGAPLPGMEVRVVDDAGRPASHGEIQVRGPGVFKEYWRRPDETRDAFTRGWFATGDVAVVKDGIHRILGRQSVDIIKTGGYKVSALEIEEVLRTHPGIAECAVVGVADAEWGQRVCAAVVLDGDCDLTLDALRVWSKQRLAAYKAPSRLLVLGALPRNAMGKVTKPAVTRLFESDGPLNAKEE